MIMMTLAIDLSPPNEQLTLTLLDVHGRGSMKHDLPIVSVSVTSPVPLPCLLQLYNRPNLLLLLVLGLVTLDLDLVLCKVTGPGPPVVVQVGHSFPPFYPRERRMRVSVRVTAEQGRSRKGEGTPLSRRSFRA